jgi:hypothetical protein
MTRQEQLLKEIPELALQANMASMVPLDPKNPLTHPRHKLGRIREKTSGRS